MAKESQIQHRVFPALIPYKTFDSPTSTDPMWQDGANLYGTARGYTERRPGFGSKLETVATAFASVQNISLFHRWDGSSNSGYYAMLCDVAGGLAKVYKLKIGVDASFALIFTGATATPFDFVVANNCCIFSNGNESRVYEGNATSVRNWGIAKPTQAPLSGTTAGANPAYAGWFYRYTYVNTSNGNESSVSDVSACTSLIDTAHAPTVQVFASADSQVTNINIYRTADGGSTNPIQMQLVFQKPNTSATYTDTLIDDNLEATYAPALYHNDPPPAMKGMVYSQQRIWGFLNNKVYYTCYEENSKGVPEECWNSAADGNTRPYAQQVRGLAELSGGVAIYTANTIFGVEGDSLDTFRWFTILQKRGAMNHLCVKSLGGSAVWIDTAKQVWLSDGGEVGKDIRPDLSNLTLSSAVLELHISQEFHWIVVAGNGNLYVHNLDTQMWQVPWPMTVTAMCSGETADGTTDLIVALNGTTVCKLTPSTFSDNGAAFAASGKTNLFDVTVKQDPEWVGVVEYVTVETNANLLSDVTQMNDDDTSTGAYASIAAGLQDPKFRGNGTNLVKKRYISRNKAMNTGTATAQRVSFNFTWPSDTNRFKLYTIDVASAAGANL